MLLIPLLMGGLMEIKLPPPKLDGKMSVEKAIYLRRSIRSYKKRELTWEEIGQLLWAGQGITDKKRGFRAAPSAGATYPLELYIIIKDGIYHYIPNEHKLIKIKDGNFKKDLYEACLHQDWVFEAPLNIIITANFERTTRYYGERGIRYVWIEAGHVAENIHLQAVALGLGSVPIGAFYDNKIKEILGVKEAPLYVIPVGEPK